jgi:hypothetical protein
MKTRANIRSRTLEKIKIKIVVVYTFSSIQVNKHAIVGMKLED